MPDQPADPIHYDMKIPPEPKDATLDADEKRGAEQNSSIAEHRGAEDVSSESNGLERTDASPRTGPSPEDARRHMP